MERVEKESKAYLSVQVYARDNEDMFIINNLFLSSTSNILFYIGTIIVSGYENWVFFLVGTGILFLNMLVLMVYMQAERELSVINNSQLRVYDGVIENTIFGTKSIRVTKSVDYFRQELMNILYKNTGVYKCNFRWVA